MLGSSRSFGLTGTGQSIDGNAYGGLKVRALAWRDRSRVEVREILGGADGFTGLQRNARLERTSFNSSSSYSATGLFEAVGNEPNRRRAAISGIEVTIDRRVG